MTTGPDWEWLVLYITHTIHIGQAVKSATAGAHVTFLYGLLLAVATNASGAVVRHALSMSKARSLVAVFAVLVSPSTEGGLGNDMGALIVTASVASATGIMLGCDAIIRGKKNRPAVTAALGTRVAILVSLILWLDLRVLWVGPTLTVPVLTAIYIVVYARKHGVVQLFSGEKRQRASQGGQVKGKGSKVKSQ